MPKFIVLSGKKQSGKTTSAQYLKAELYDRGFSVKITSFAAPIKDFCIEVIGLSEEQVYGTDQDKNSDTNILWKNMPIEIRKRYGFPNAPVGVTTARARSVMTAREVMQIFGTDIMRKFFDFDIWARAPFAKYGSTHHDYIIIDDCRFPNEADMAIEHGATLIRLTRDVLIGDPHISEKAMDDYDKSRYNRIVDNHMYDNIDCLYADLGRILDETT